MRIEKPEKNGPLKFQDKKGNTVAITQVSPEELALRAQRGSQESFAELVHRFGGRLLTFLHHKTGNLEDAEDLVQDTFTRAYRNIRNYQSSFKFSTWLFTIAGRLASSHYRDKKKLQSASLKYSDEINNREVIKEQSSENLWFLAQELSKNQYEVLWLRYAENLSIKEIAKVMSKSQINVKVLLYRARRNMTEKLKENPVLLNKL